MEHTSGQVLPTTSTETVAYDPKTDSYQPTASAFALSTAARASAPPPPPDTLTDADVDNADVDSGSASAAPPPPTTPPPQEGQQLPQQPPTPPPPPLPVQEDYPTLQPAPQSQQHQEQIAARRTMSAATESPADTNGSFPAAANSTAPEPPPPPPQEDHSTLQPAPQPQQHQEQIAARRTVSAAVESSVPADADGKDDGGFQAASSADESSSSLAAAQAVTSQIGSDAVLASDGPSDSVSDRPPAGGQLVHGNVPEDAPAVKLLPVQKEDITNASPQPVSQSDDQMQPDSSRDWAKNVMAAISEANDVLGGGEASKPVVVGATETSQVKVQEEAPLLPAVSAELFDAKYVDTRAITTESRSPVGTVLSSGDSLPADSNTNDALADSSMPASGSRDLLDDIADGSAPAGSRGGDVLDDIINDHSAVSRGANGQTRQTADSADAIADRPAVANAATAVESTEQEAEMGTQPAGSSDAALYAAMRDIDSANEALAEELDAEAELEDAADDLAAEVVAEEALGDLADAAAEEAMPIAADEVVIEAIADDAEAADELIAEAPEEQAFEKAVEEFADETADDGAAEEAVVVAVIADAETAEDLAAEAVAEEAVEELIADAVVQQAIEEATADGVSEDAADEATAEVVVVAVIDDAETAEDLAATAIFEEAAADLVASAVMEQAAEDAFNDMVAEAVVEQAAQEAVDELVVEEIIQQAAEDAVHELVAEAIDEQAAEDAVDELAAELVVEEAASQTARQKTGQTAETADGDAASQTLTAVFPDDASADVALIDATITQGSLEDPTNGSSADVAPINDVSTDVGLIDAKIIQDSLKNPIEGTSVDVTLTGATIVQDITEAVTGDSDGDFEDEAAVMSVTERTAVRVDPKAPLGRDAAGTADGTAGGIDELIAVEEPALDGTAGNNDDITITAGGSGDLIVMTEPTPVGGDESAAFAASAAAAPVSSSGSLGDVTIMGSPTLTRDPAAAAAAGIVAVEVATVVVAEDGETLGDVEVDDAPPAAPLGRDVVEGMVGEGGNSAASEAVAAALAATVEAAVLAAPEAALPPTGGVEGAGAMPDGQDADVACDAAPGKRSDDRDKAKDGAATTVPDKTPAGVEEAAGVSRRSEESLQGSVPADNSQGSIVTRAWSLVLQLIMLLVNWLYSFLTPPAGGQAKEQAVGGRLFPRARKGRKGRKIGA